jgi:predicted nucleic acid-binding protein
LTVVSDTSVLIAFESLGKLQILKKIFRQIIIPEGVYKELKVEKGEFAIESWIIVKQIANTDLFRRLYLDLGEGESETITLSIEEHADFTLLDDKEARKEAIDLNLKVIGTAGILLSAKRKGLIPSVMDEIRKLVPLGISPSPPFKHSLNDIDLDFSSRFPTLKLNLTLVAL